MFATLVPGSISFFGVVSPHRAPQARFSSLMASPEADTTPAEVPDVGEAGSVRTYIKCGKCGATYTIEESSLGHPRAKGKKVQCSVCDHSWFQSKERLFTLKDGFEFEAFGDAAKERVRNNLSNNRRADFAGEAKLYIGNLDFNSQDSDVQEFFKEAGEVGDVSIVRDDTGRSRGFAFVTMMTKEGGEKAMELDGKDLMGRPVQIRAPN